MELLTNSFFERLPLKKAGKVAAVSAAMVLGLTGVEGAIAPAHSANPADVARLLETGACKACDLSNADLTGEHLIGVDLRDADLTGAVLEQANLEGADLTGATLVGTDFTGAFLTNALLDETTIRNANFSESTLYYTSMEGANVGPVTLIGADVLNTPISVGGSYYDE